MTRALRSRIRSVSYRPGLEDLEGRWVPAQYGVPWHDAKLLTLSFVPDGTAIGARTSDLFRTLDAVGPTADWQRTILRAFQSWAVPAHINFALTPDGGQPFGSPGPDQHDPRFGDIRIGARPMSPEVLSISVPHDPFLSGTFSGDILLNSAVDPEVWDEALYPVMLHEIGHVLGFDHSDDPDSVLYSHLGDGTSRLDDADVRAVQALYRPRPRDSFETRTGNDTIATAYAFPQPAGFDGSTPLFLYADISSSQDADTFSLRVLAGYDGPATIRLQTAGVSLLVPRLTVFDAHGAILADAISQADAGDTLVVSLPRVEPDATYFLQARAADDAFGVGEYALAASFDGRTFVTAAALDTLARQSYSYLTPEDLRTIFLDPQGALFRQDRHTDDSFASAIVLKPIGAYGQEAPHRITASLGDPADIDYYRIETPYGAFDQGSKGPPGPPLVMTVTVRAPEVNAIQASVSVFDEYYRPVPAVVLARGGGTATIQVGDAQAGAAYFVRVEADPHTGKIVGNYSLDVEYGRIAADPTTFLDSALDSSTGPSTYDLVVNQTQLFDFLLAADGPASSDAFIQMSISDATGKLLATRTAHVGETRGGDPLLLLSGAYRVTFRVETPAGPPPEPLTFRLYGASLSDPIGPAPDDPTLRPLAGPTPIGPGTVGLPAFASSNAPYLWLAHALAADPETPGPGLISTVPGDSDLQATAGQSLGPAPVRLLFSLTAPPPNESRPPDILKHNGDLTHMSEAPPRVRSRAQGGLSTGLEATRGVRPFDAGSEDPDFLSITDPISIPPTRLPVNARAAPPDRRADVGDLLATGEDGQSFDLAASLSSIPTEPGGDTAAVSSSPEASESDAVPSQSRLMEPDGETKPSVPIHPVPMILVFGAAALFYYGRIRRCRAFGALASVLRRRPKLMSRPPLRPLG